MCGGSTFGYQGATMQGQKHGLGWCSLCRQICLEHYCVPGSTVMYSEVAALATLFDVRQCW